MSEKSAPKSIAEQYPLLAERWDEKSNNTTLEDLYISPFSDNEKYFWKCNNGYLHSYQSRVKSLIYDPACRICSNHQLLLGFNDLATVYPKLAAQWHPTQNGKLTPEIITFKYSKLIWWLGKCGHGWKSPIAKRSRGAECPVCPNRQVVAGYTDLATICPPEIFSEWDHQKNSEINLNPTMIGLNSAREAWWICTKYSHSYLAQVSSRVRTARETLCPYCLGWKLLSGFNDLSSKCPELAKEWDYINNDNLQPTQVLALEYKVVSWICITHGSYRQNIFFRSRDYFYFRWPVNDCPICYPPKSFGGGTSKIEIKFFEAFRLLFPDAENGKVLIVPWKKKNNQMSIDIWFTQNDGSEVVIEFDGAYFHDGRCSNKGLDWHLDHDGIKTIALLNAGFTVVRIRSNQLPHLELSHPQLFQVSHDETKGDIGATVSTILGFLNSK